MLNETELKGKEMTLLEAFVMVAPYLNKITQDDISVSVYDTERLLRYVPAETFSLNLKLGEPLIEGDIPATFSSASISSRSCSERPCLRAVPLAFTVNAPAPILENSFII